MLFKAFYCRKTKIFFQLKNQQRDSTEPLKKLISFHPPPRD